MSRFTLMKANTLTILLVQNLEDGNTVRNL